MKHTLRREEEEETTTTRASTDRDIYRSSLNVLVEGETKKTFLPTFCGQS